jgi:hypothetical protein
MPAMLIAASAIVTSASTAVISFTRSGVRPGSCRTDRQNPPELPETDIRPQES